MFKKLHIQMTLFASLITSTILVALTCICLLISENGLKKNTESSFMKELNVMITNIQNQDYISLQWINQLRDNNHYQLFFYDSGTPLFTQKLYADEKDTALAEKARFYALEQYGLDISVTNSKILSVHKEFSIKDDFGTDYYAAAGVIPKSKGSLGFIILLSLEEQDRQILAQRLLFTIVDAAAILLLFLFSWFFTGKMIVPLEKNRKSQIQFIASASHELRAPLTVILSGTDALSKAEAPSVREHFTRIIKTEGLRMQHLISDMLFLARSDSGSFPVTAVRCQPDVLLLDIYEKYELQAHDKKRSLILNLPDDMSNFCLCDPERITQVLSILLDNAISYTPEGGRITLSMSQDSTHYLKLIVENTGPGIPDSEKEAVFERFYRSQSSHTDKQHFGLGLCIAREIICSHHGQLWVEDAPDGGPRFIFTLPVMKRP